MAQMLAAREAVGNYQPSKGDWRGDGVAILPSGHIIHIPPGDPSGPLFRQIAAGIAEVARGFGVRQVIADSAVPSSSKAIGTATLELMAKSLESVSQAVNKALTEASNGGTISNH